MHGHRSWGNRHNGELDGAVGSEVGAVETERAPLDHPEGDVVDGTDRRAADGSRNSFTSARTSTAVTRSKDAARLRPVISGGRLRLGELPISRRVYGCCGSWSTWAVGPASTTTPFESTTMR